MQRKAVEQVQKETNMETQLHETLAKLQEIASHTEQQNKKRIDDAEKALAQTQKATIDLVKAQQTQMETLMMTLM